jgi:hypothetical protein
MIRFAIDVWDTSFYISDTFTLKLYLLDVLAALSPVSTWQPSRSGTQEPQNLRMRSPHGKPLTWLSTTPTTRTFTRTNTNKDIEMVRQDSADLDLIPELN